MGGSKWEDLPDDCLVNIFGRVGLKSLVEGVPYACKSWFKATLSPLCWQSLIIPFHLPGTPFKYKFSGVFICDGSRICMISLLLDRFIKFLIRRSHGSAKVVDLTDVFELSMKPEVLNYIGEGCPLLMKLVLPNALDNPFPNLPTLICKWKELVALQIDGGCSMLNDVIPQLSVHCKSFVSLSVPNAQIGESEASSIATFLPNIENLWLRNSKIRRTSLLMILNKCRKLVSFDAGIFINFHVDDEIKNLASPIKTFKFKVGYDYEMIQNALRAIENDEDSEYFEFGSVC